MGAIKEVSPNDMIKYSTKLMRLISIYSRYLKLEIGQKRRV